MRSLKWIGRGVLNLQRDMWNGRTDSRILVYHNTSRLKDGRIKTTLFSAMSKNLYDYDHEFKVTFSIKKISGNSYREFQNRSLNRKLTPVKVTRHTMPQKEREHFNLTGFKWTNGYILMEKVSWCPVNGVTNLGKTTQIISNYLNICLLLTFFNLWNQI
jgi:hypothetical protein